jgi:OOP family OmpA-OmpF porin
MKKLTPYIISIFLLFAYSTNAQDSKPLVAPKNKPVVLPKQATPEITVPKRPIKQNTSATDINTSRTLTDKDGDGIYDYDDVCPDVAGKINFRGCPDYDRDGDGIVNDKDRCPDIAGSFAAIGCPDRDGDGVMDNDDKCPDYVGPASNKGCPMLSEDIKKRLAFAARNIQFEAGKSIIKPVSYKILDEVASILNIYPYYDVNVDGHTDNTEGYNAAANLKLSQDRAASAVTYLIGKGIPASRLVSAGYGDTKPVGDNKTAAGRAQNRRIEFNLLFKD